MSGVLLIGVIVLAGFVTGELAARAHLPKVTGYILAGVLLNPRLCGFVSESFAEETTLVTDVALSFITFAIGGELRWAKVRKLGRSVLGIAVLESTLAFVAVFACSVLIGPLLLGGGVQKMLIPAALLMASLAAPTDPTATLAVVHEMDAKGEVAMAVLGVAALDDVLGILNYSIAVPFAQALLQDVTPGFHSGLHAVIGILGGVLLGAGVGFLFNAVSRFVRQESEGVYIAMLCGILPLCLGVARAAGVEGLLATLAAGAVVANFNDNQVRIYEVLERYTEQLIFLLFFTLSGLHLKFEALAASAGLVALFVVGRALGKAAGVWTGATLTRAPDRVRRYTTGGLLPQGGIVIGLALLIRQDPAFSPIADLVIGATIGGAVIHEIFGPIAARQSLQAADEAGA